MLNDIEDDVERRALMPQFTCLEYDEKYAPSLHCKHHGLQTNELSASFKKSVKSEVGRETFVIIIVRDVLFSSQDKYALHEDDGRGG